MRFDNMNNSDADTCMPVPDVISGSRTELDSETESHSNRNLTSESAKVTIEHLSSPISVVTECTSCLSISSDDMKSVTKAILIKDSDSMTISSPVAIPPAEYYEATRHNAKCQLSDGSIDFIMILQSSSGTVYELGDQIKKAVYGHVNVGYVLDPIDEVQRLYRRTDIRVAIKIMKKAVIRAYKGAAENPENEIGIMQYIKKYKPCTKAPFIPISDGETINYSNLINFIESCKDPNYIYSIMEYIDGCDLMCYVEELVKNNENMPQAIAQNIFRQIITGLQTLHALGVCHRDLSLENVMITKDFSRCVIIDYGMALLCHRDPETGVFHKFPPLGRAGKSNYMSPEVYKNFAPFEGQKSDIWSLGSILFIMLAKIPAFEEASLRNQAFLCVSKGLLPRMITRWGLKISPEAIQLINKLFTIKPEDRLSLNQILEDDWFNNQ